MSREPLKLMAQRARFWLTLGGPLERCPTCAKRLWRARSQCPSCGYLFALYASPDISDLEWRALTKTLSDEGSYRFTINQLFIEWQRRRASKVRGAELRLTLSGAALWTALFPPASPAPLTALLPDLAAHLTARGALWSLSLSLLILVTPWRLMARPLPLPPWLTRLGARSLWLLSWALPLAMLATSLLWIALQQLPLQLPTELSAGWPLPWARPSGALLPAALLGLASYLDVGLLTARAGRGRFTQHLTQWLRVYQLPELLSRPEMQVPTPQLRGGLYQEEVRKVLIVDQDLTVDLLAHNGLHDRGHFLVVSLQRYPSAAARVTKRLLIEHPEEVELYLLHHEGRDEEAVKAQLKALGVTPKHRLVRLGWRHQDLGRLTAHLGFKPIDWEVFAVDTLSPRALLESVAASLALGVPLLDRLALAGGFLPAPPQEELERQTGPRALPAHLTPQPDALGVLDDQTPEQESALSPLSERGGER